MKVVSCIIKLLILIGAINWGLVGFFQFDLVASIFGGMMSMGARVVYSLVGIAGVIGLCRFAMRCCGCSPCGCGCGCGSNCKCKSGGSCGSGSCGSQKKDEWKH